MGNEISRKRYCCRKARKFERLATVQENPAADLPVAQTALGAVFWSRLNHPPKEKSEDTTTGMRNKDIGKESELAPSSLPVAQIQVRTTEPQDLSEAWPSAEQSEEAENKRTTSPGRQTCAPTQARCAAAQQADVTPVSPSDLPPQTAAETGARDAADVVTELATAEGTSAGRKRPRRKMCKASPLCRWLKKLKSPAGKAKAKPDATASQE